MGTNQPNFFRIHSRY